MGIYATIEGIPEGYDNQLKCWGENGLFTYRAGDRVPPIECYTTYSVRHHEFACNDRQYLHVVNCVIASVYAHLVFPGAPVFDKWGQRL